MALDDTLHDVAFMLRQDAEQTDRYDPETCMKVEALAAQVDALYRELYPAWEPGEFEKALKLAVAAHKEKYGDQPPEPCEISDEELESELEVLEVKRTMHLLQKPRYAAVFLRGAN